MLDFLPDQIPSTSAKSMFT